MAWPKGEASRVFDYLDRPVALRGAFQKRLRIYGGMGVEILKDGNYECE